MRLVQSGQYADAIKLDQQFASIRVGRGTQATQAMERRRKMIEDVVAALPSIERQEIEEKLQAVEQRKPGALTKSVQVKPVATDLSMSWEEILPPPRVAAITSGAPRFVLGRPTYGHNQPKLVAGPVTDAPPAQPVRSLLAPARTQLTENVVPPGLNGTSLVRGTNALTLPLPSSRAGLKVELFGPGPQTNKPLLNSSGSGGHGPSSLFPSRTRDPRHLVGNEAVLYSQKTTLDGEQRVKDLALQRDAVSQLGAETRSDEDQHKDHAQAFEPVPVTEFSESVFLTASRPEPSPYPYARETTEPQLPGAFGAERGMAQLEPNLFTHSPPTPPTRLRPAKSRRTTRTSVPGGFNEDASGEEDNLPPLPEVSSVKRATRRRTLRASSADATEEDNAPSKPRRSSRLSAASSSSEPSPQKTSAPKAKRKTRGSAGSSATTGIASSTRSSTKKRR